MNRKYIKENKVVLREFLAQVIGAVLAGKASKNMDKEIRKSPELMKQREKVKKAAKELEKQALAMVKKHPEKLPALRKYYKKFGIRV